MVENRCGLLNVSASSQQLCCAAPIRAGSMGACMNNPPPLFVNTQFRSRPGDLLTVDLADHVPHNWLTVTVLTHYILHQTWQQHKGASIVGETHKTTLVWDVWFEKGHQRKLLGSALLLHQRLHRVRLRVILSPVTLLNIHSYILLNIKTKTKGQILRCDEIR